MDRQNTGEILSDLGAACDVAPIAQPAIKQTDTRKQAQPGPQEVGTKRTEKPAEVKPDVVKVVTKPKVEDDDDKHCAGTKLGHYVLGKNLGKGTFGKVKQAQHELTLEMVAIKILEKARIKDKKDIERISREIKILKKVRHPNVIQLYEIIETNTELYLIMEFCPNGELFDYIV